MSPRDSFTNPWLFQEVKKESTKEAEYEEVSPWHCAFDAYPVGHVPDVSTPVLTRNLPQGLSFLVFFLLKENST